MSCEVIDNLQRYNQNRKKKAKQQTQTEKSQTNTYISVLNYPKSEIETKIMIFGVWTWCNSTGLWQREMQSALGAIHKEITVTSFPFIGQFCSFRQPYIFFYYYTVCFDIIFHTLRISKVKITEDSSAVGQNSSLLPTAVYERLGFFQGFSHFTCIPKTSYVTYEQCSR